VSRLTSATPLTVSGTVGTTPVTILAKNKMGQYLSVHNPNGDTGAFLAATYDNLTAPLVFGAGSRTISPLSADDFEVFIPNGALQLVSDQSGGAKYSVMYLGR
jgi:hypothetical protein